MVCNLVRMITDIDFKCRCEYQNVYKVGIKMKFIHCKTDGIHRDLTTFVKSVYGK